MFLKEVVVCPISHMLEMLHPMRNGSDLTRKFFLEVVVVPYDPIAKLRRNLWFI